MRRTVRVLVVLALVIAVASAGAWAQRNTPRLPKVGPGETYLKADIWKGVNSDFNQMPIVDEGGGFSPATMPSGVETTKSHNETFGAAIPGSSFGVAFLTPIEKTGKEIRKVIARLG